MEKKEEKKVCCICGKEYEGYGYLFDESKEDERGRANMEHHER